MFDPIRNDPRFQELAAEKKPWFQTRSWYFAAPKHFAFDSRPNVTRRLKLPLNPLVSRWAGMD